MQELSVAALEGCVADGHRAMPTFSVTALEAVVLLASKEEAQVRVAPGERAFECKLRALEGQSAPRLCLTFAGGTKRIVALTEVESGRWHGAFVAEQVVSTLALHVTGPGRFIFAGAWLSADPPHMGKTPTLREGAIAFARAVFAKLPLELRRRLLASGARARFLKRLRTAKGDRPGASLSPPSATRSCEALRADFDNRAAVARGLHHPSHVSGPLPNPPLNPPVKIVAFYLPQYHPIAENDAWWGQGFTEWTNVAKAQPQFVGHHQPRLPGELGFYDLRTPGVLSAQAQLARAYGISAFCFHYYWFAGRRLLERPLDAFLADPSIDIGFCLCWANENWTRRWDGEDQSILIAQEHSLDDHARVFADMARYMEDPRYLRINGAPVVVVYRPDIIAHAREMTALWRAEAIQRGWSGVYLVATSAFRFEEPQKLGFDALAEFPPHGLVADRAAGIDWINSAHQGLVFDYEKVAAAETRRLRNAPKRGVVFPGVMPSWDNEARRPGGGAIYHGATPEAYGAWLKAALDRAMESLPDDRRLLFINAWNEWAEGAYLEPDRKFGRAFLAETARQLMSL